MQRIERLPLQLEVLGHSSQQQRQRRAGFKLGLLQVGDGDLGGVEGRLLGGQVDGARHRNIESGLHHVQKLFGYIAIGLRNREPLAQRQQLEIPVGDTGQRRQRDRVLLGPGCAGQQPCRFGRGAVLTPEVDLVARR